MTVGSQQTAQNFVTNKNSTDSAPVADVRFVVSEMRRLSQRFEDSYQELEGEVADLNSKLVDEARAKEQALKEKERLLIEKTALANRVQKLLAILPSGVVVLDGNGRVTECNAVAVDLLGRPLLGERWHDVIARAFAPQADDGHQISTKDGKKLHVETRALEHEPGQIVVLTDLTKTRQLQAALSQQQKVNSLGKMVASLAHQIRTPLSAALIYGSHLNDDRVDAETRRQFTTQLMERLHYMERQINDMLAFIRGERREKSWIDIERLFEQIAAQCKTFNIPVHCVMESSTESQARLFCDPDSLRGAIINLVENAVHACQNHSDQPQVKVCFRCDESLTIQVSDNGIGIEPQKQAKIFEPFYSEKNNGNGLGLAIVKGVVIAHQGKIKLQSTLNKGTTFRIELPLQTNTQDTNRQYQFGGI